VTRFVSDRSRTTKGTKYLPVVVNVVVVVHVVDVVVLARVLSSMLLMLSMM